MKHKLLKKLAKWNKPVLTEEKRLLISFGLRNKKELQKVYYLISKIKKIKEESFDYCDKKQKLIKEGLLTEANSLLDITVESFLNRRLQTIVANKKKIAMKHSRQLITHGHVKLNNIKLKSPSQILKLEQDDKLDINFSKL